MVVRGIPVNRTITTPVGKTIQVIFPRGATATVAEAVTIPPDQLPDVVGVKIPAEGRVLPLTRSDQVHVDPWVVSAAHRVAAALRPAEAIPAAGTKF